MFARTCRQPRIQSWTIPISRNRQHNTLKFHRFYSAETGPPPPPPPKPLPIPAELSRILRRAKTFARYTGYLAISTVFGVFTLGTGIFIHDVFTYTDKHVDRVPVSPLALHPERGGPKNLPVVRVQVADGDDEENRILAEKPRLIIVGGGWGVRL